LSIQTGGKRSVGSANQILHTRAKTPPGETKDQGRRRKSREEPAFVAKQKAIANADQTFTKAEADAQQTLSDKVATLTAQYDTDVADLERPYTNDVNQYYATYMQDVAAAEIGLLMVAQVPGAFTKHAVS